MLAQVYYYFFGLVAIAGGAMGYTRAKSKASLIAGGVSGALLIIAGLLAPSVSGFVLALIVSILLLTYFGRSYMAKKKSMLAIPMIVLSSICIVLTAIAWHAR